MPEFENVDGELTLTLEESSVGSTYNGLDMTSEGYALDARQGYALDQKKLDRNRVLNNLSTVAEGYALDARQGKWLDENKVGFGDVVNDVTSDDPNKVLSAAQGKVLRTMLSNKLDSNMVVNDLVTASKFKALSAEQGRVLKVLVDTKATAAVANVSLPASGWSGKTQTVSVSGVTAGNIVVVTAAPASYTTYRDCGVYCSAQASGSLTFKCSTVPGGTITAQALILN